jgi:hypothetical protein
MVAQEGMGVELRGMLADLGIDSSPPDRPGAPG